MAVALQAAACILEGCALSSDGLTGMASRMIQS
ncbi:hypothetical protein XaFJ1_GM001514 [Xanthomonas albilineans]|nr:hypothetical protein XaFJ1_GM001514 [Xanthomonas albilineans]